MDEAEAGKVVSHLVELGVRASVVRRGVYRAGVRVLVGDGREALWDVDGAAGLEAQVMRNNVLVGFVPHIEGSEGWGPRESAAAIAATDYDVKH